MGSRVEKIPQGHRRMVRVELRLDDRIPFERQLADYLTRRQGPKTPSASSKIKALAMLGYELRQNLREMQAQDRRSTSTTSPSDREDI